MSLKRGHQIIPKGGEMVTITIHAREMIKIHLEMKKLGVGDKNVIG